MNKDAEKNIRVVLYCELYRFLGGIFYRGVGTGFITSYRNQMRTLAAENIFFTENLREDADILQVNSHGPRTFLLMRKFKRRGKKIVIYAHATVEDLRIGFRILHFFVVLLRRYLSLIYNTADMVVCPSAHTARLLQEGYSVPKEKTAVISNGVDVNAFVPDPAKRERSRRAAGVPGGALVVIDVAMAIQRKGIATFIAMGKAFPKTRFVWYGKVFSAFFAPKIPPHTENVIFRGYVPDIAAAYAGADIFLFPSFAENQGISVLEAGAAGLPIVVRDIPVFQGWLSDGKECLKAKTDEDFREKIALLSENPELRRTLGGAMQQHVRAEHSFEAVGKKLRTLYSALLAGGQEK